MHKSLLYSAFFAIFLGNISAHAADLPPPEICHFDDPAPYFQFLNTLTRANQSPTPPDCAQEISAADAPSELVLPLPCGHQMYFRRVDVRVRDMLDFKTVFLGDANATARSTLARASSMPRAQRLSGSFYRDDPDTAGIISYFYIGKYETAIAQWRLFEEGLFDLPLNEALNKGSTRCMAHEAWLRSETAPIRMLPATSISWFDANAFARAYTLWLIQLDNALIDGGSRPLLPWREGSSGFLRLPTEVEWEYAARGGSKHVSREALSRATYQVKKDGALRDAELREIAQIDGLMEGVHVNGIGKRLPNVLEIYDMLGNAEELVLDLFQATRPNGLKGQPGGVVLRGGSTLTNDALIGLGYRLESNLYDRTGEVKSAAAGVRFALSAPFFVSGFDDKKPYAPDLSNQEMFDALDVAQNKITQREGLEDEVTAAMEQFEDLANNTSDPDMMRTLLTEARLLVDQSLDRQIKSQRETLEERWITAASLLLGTDRTGANAYVAAKGISDLLSKREKMKPSDRKRVEQRIPNFVKRLETLNREVDAMFATYIETLGAVAVASREDRGIARGDAGSRIAAMGAPRLDDALQMIDGHLELTIQDGSGVSGEHRDAWLLEIDSYRLQRLKLIDDIRAEARK